MFALAQDGEPAQTRLESLEAYLFVQPSIIVYRFAPLVIVVRNIERVITTPPTAVVSIWVTAQPIVR